MQHHRKKRMEWLCCSVAASFFNAKEPLHCEGLTRYNVAKLTQSVSELRLICPVETKKKRLLYVLFLLFMIHDISHIQNK